MAPNSLDSYRAYKGHYKVQNQGALGNYICQKMVSKLAKKYMFPKRIKISEAWKSMEDMKSRFEFFFQKSYIVTQHNHSHKKWKDSLETRDVLLIFSLDLEISAVAMQSIHQNSKKWRLLLGSAQ